VVAFLISGGFAAAVVILTHAARHKNRAVIISSAADKHAVERGHLARDLCWLISLLLFSGYCVEREYVVVSLRNVSSTDYFDGRNLQVSIRIKLARVEYHENRMFVAFEASVSVRPGAR
jgi:hypothetical protein